MAESGSHIRLDQAELSELAAGFLGADLINSPAVELTYITASAGSGHDFHAHDDLEEILIFLEGGCTFTLGSDEHEVRAGSVIHAPVGVKHKVSYDRPAKVIRIKVPAARA